MRLPFREFAASLAMAVLLLTGCASGPALVGSERVQVLDITSLPPPTHPDYTIGPLDKLKINVFGVEELNMETIQVDANGSIVVPLAGELLAEGKTPAALSAEIARSLARGGVRDPRVSVNLQEIVSRTVTVDGQVNKPGQYPLGGETTLMRSIASAGGLSEYAQPRRVVLYRKVGDQQMAALYDLAAIRQGIYEDPKVYSNDIVVVGESQARRMFGYLIASSGLLVAPLVTILQ